jgi:general stress protein YciG
METPKEYYYTYYSYEEWGRGYFGSRGCKCLPEEDVKYFGSSKDKTFKPKHKIILKSDYATRAEAYTDEIILQEYYKVVENPHFANKSYQTSTKFYLPTEKAKELGVGFYSLTPEQRIENGKKGGSKGGKVQYENKIGIHGLSFEERSRRSKEIGLKHKENKTGICGRSKEKMSEDGRKAGKKAVEINKKNGTSFWDTKLQSELGKRGGSISGKKNAKILNSQKWMCTETGFITNPGSLSRYQRARGIDTSKRERIE